MGRKEGNPLGVIYVSIIVLLDLVMKSYSVRQYKGVWQ